MEIFTTHIDLDTNGNTHIIDITRHAQDIISEQLFTEGQLTIFTLGSTTGISTVEYEPGLVHHDIREMFHKIAPYNVPYKHNETWNDNNGASHLRSTLIKTSMVFPFSKSKLILGTWQQIIFLDFDTRPRNRQIVFQIIGIKK